MIAGRYSLDREIGRGGTGAVWAGRDEVLGRRVALKRIGLLPGADVTDLARAEREAQLSARLNHPHVVAIFDVVVDAEVRWLVMEHVDGPTLAQVVRQEGPLAPDEAGRVLGQAADALLAAHAAGIVHRDVKPSNILLDPLGQVKLTDFGIARVLEDASLTRTGLLTGSPAYLAPEVASGHRGDERADVWSLGATAFHLLAGRPPYEVGDNVMGALYRIVHDAPPRLDDAGWLEPMLAGTMVRDPEQRWSMAQVRDFLTSRRLPSEAPVPPTVTSPLAAPAYAAGPSTPDAPTSVVPGVAEDRRRGRVPLPALLGLLVALVLGVVLVLALRGGGSDPEAGGSGPTASASPTASAGPTSAGMEAFIRDYVEAVGEDPDTSWQMLTPTFQRESGGIERYRAFWDAATDGRVLSIESNPEDLSVSYQVRFENFDNGPGPTVLDLVYEDGTYRIDGERSEGFTPVG